jgi:2-phospho-L-lactate guanylyltransferase
MTDPEPTRTVAILPVKSFSKAKQRLSDSLEPEERAGLAERMLTSVLNALSQAVPHTIVVTADARAKDLAAQVGATVIHDPHETGQSDAVSLGIEHAPQADRVLCIPGDCPAITPQEITDLLAIDADVVIVPDRHGTGTNALLLTPPTIIAPSFGEGSFARHAALARGAWATIEVAHLRGLLHDVDTPEDLQALRALQA